MTIWSRRHLGLRALWACVFFVLPSPSLRAADRTFEITASRFRYDPAVIEVEEGDHVTLRLHSTDTDHGLEIKALKVKVLVPASGAVVSAQLVAGSAGTYTFKCFEYCGLHHDQMRGQLVVKPKASR